MMQNTSTMFVIFLNISKLLQSEMATSVKTVCTNLAFWQSDGFDKRFEPIEFQGTQ